MNLVKTGKNVECHSLFFGHRKISFFLSFSKRKNLNISVHPDQKVTVDAPVNKSLDEIFARVKKRAPWIIKQKNYFERFQPLPTQRQYVSGETHYYLGRQFRLKVLKRKIDGVKLIGSFFYIYSSNRNDTKKTEELLNKWHEEHARKIFTKRFEICFLIAMKHKIPQPKIRFRKMLKRWGSCTKSGTITLNYELIKAPLHCIDYVIMHELCHLRIHSHGKYFNKLLSKCMPDWEWRKERLERVII
ncbi:MAG TPA: M48 family peptidase [Nitrospirae bacterium]|nr:M48 family peptidase [Nitrospirota bacterium]